MGYVCGLGPLFYSLYGGLQERAYATILGLDWVGCLIWMRFCEAKKIEAKVRQN
jgi:hypothetical protein